MINITIKQLEVFVAIAKSGNMTQAATTLHLTQSACSMALSAIETQLGSALFDRHGKKLFLNEQGRMLFPKATNIIAQLAEIHDLMNPHPDTSLTGHLLVGASTTIGNYLLPSIIGRFAKTHSSAKISLTVSNSEQVIRQLLNFEIDIGIIEGHCYSSDIDITPWMSDELIIIAPTQHVLANKRKITLDQLHQAQWILREPGSGTREKCETAFHGKIKPFLELGSTEAIKQAVISGIGISCLSRMTVIDLLTSKQLIELAIPNLKLTRDFLILTHKDKYKTTILNQFIKTCQEYTHRF